MSFAVIPKHKLLGHYIRQHWRIENSQHYILGWQVQRGCFQDSDGGMGREYGAIPAVRIEYRKTEQLWCSKSENKLKEPAGMTTIGLQLFFG